MGGRLDLLRSPFTRKVGGMMAYTAIGQSVYLLTGPLIGRLFTPAQFGIYGLFYAFAVTAAGLIFLNFDYAIPAASSGGDARRLTIGAAAIALICAPLAGIVAASLSWLGIAGFEALPASCAFLVVVLLLSQGAVQLLQNWCIRDDATIEIGKSSITLNVVRGATQVLMGALAPFWWSLALGEVVGRIVNANYLGHRRRWRWRDAVNVWHGHAYRDVAATLQAYRQFPLVLLPSQTLDSAVGFIQSAALAYFYGPAGLGMFFLMRRTLDLPVAFAFRSLSDIFYARQAHDARTAPERVRPFFVRSALLLGTAGFLVGIPGMFASPMLFTLVFGEQWRQAGIMAAIMVPAAVMNLAVAPVARVFALTTRPHLRFCFTVTNLFGTILAFVVVAWASLDIVAATIALSITTFVAYVVYFIAGYVASSALRPVGNLAPQP
jgi:O-antigen/teichoic acid export membrane protein